MSDEPKRGIVIASYLLPVCIYLFFHFFFPFNICDDAYITLKTAVNLSEGNGLVFNAGEKAYVLTNPLWAILLGGGRSLGFDITLVIRFLCVFFQITFLILAVYLGRIITKSAATGALFAILMITNPIYLLSCDGGMEYAIFFTFITLGIILFLKKHYLWSLIAGAITIWVRFDGILVYFVLLISFLYVLIKNRHQFQFKRISAILPSLIIFGAYFLFAYLYYGHMIPHSVQMKASISSEIMSGEWFHGAKQTLNQILRAINTGSLVFFHTSPGLTYIFTFFSLFAWIHFFVSRDYQPLILVLYGILYILIYVGNGSLFALGHSWYYCPTFLLAYFFSAWGVMLVFKRIVNSKRVESRFEVSMFILVLVILVFWIPLSTIHISKNVRNLEEIELKRELFFAVCGIWAGKNLPENATIVTDDMGAVGFFTRPDITVVDYFLILRAPGHKYLDRAELIKRDMPIVVFPRWPGEIIKDINLKIPGEYTWFEFSTYKMGLRSDLAQTFAPDENEIIQITNDLNLNREYVW